MKIRDTWATPPDLRKAITKAFGQPAYDACASHDNFFSFRHDYYTIEQDGLSRGWSNNELTWCNPPGSQVALWTAKALEQLRLGRQSLLLVQCGIESNWYKTVKPYCETIFLTPRPQFIPPQGIPKSSNARNYMLLHFQRHYLTIPGERTKWWQWKPETKRNKKRPTARPAVAGSHDPATNPTEGLQVHQVHEVHSVHSPSASLSTSAPLR